MKKTLIAGAASVALAAMPVMGVFAAAENPADITDTIDITIADSCTWSRTSSTTDSDVTANAGAFSATMTAGQEKATFGKSVLNVKCNNVKGYKIKATMTGLDGYLEAAHTNTNNDKIEYATALAAGKWTATYNNAGITSGNTFVDNTPEANASGADNMSTGTNYEITYGVHTKAAQTAGYYTGSVVYNLTQNS